MPIASSTTSDTQQYLRALVYGPPGTTKSASSVTVSDFCPPDWTHKRLTETPKRDLVSLADMLWLPFDAQATYGFRQLGVSVPVLEFPNIYLGNHQTVIQGIIKECEAAVAAGTKTIVADTISTLDTNLVESIRAKGFEKLDLWSELKIWHTRLQKGLDRLPCNILYLCHAKAAAETETSSTSDAAIKMAEVAAKKQKASGIKEIVPQISGSSLNLYRGNVSHVFYATRAKRADAPGQPPSDGFYFASDAKEFDTKSRLILPTLLPANWRVVKQYV